MSLQPYDLMSETLYIIENHITESITITEISGMLSISPVHLQRLFKFAFGIPLASYIRSRKLAVGARLLMETDYHVIDIAYELGFTYEQTFIRAFKQEFGITPSGLRKSGPILKITPPLHMFPQNRLSEGALFGPDIVMVPEIYLIGRKSVVPFSQSVVVPPQLAKSFWFNDRIKIKGILEPDVYYGLTHIRDIKDGYSFYMPSVKVKKNAKIPFDLKKDVFPSCSCARFHYIGRHHYYDINVDIARGMYDAIVEFVNKEDKRYRTLNQELYFERIDSADYDGTYCQMEWFTPIYPVES